MAEPFSEPANEEEAERLERFLEEGAAVIRETVASVPAIEGATAVLDEPVAVRFEVSPRDLLEQVDEEPGRQVWLELDIVGAVEPNLSMHVFINNDGADAGTPREDRTAVGGLAFFCMVEETPDGDVCLLPGDQALTHRLHATNALEATPDERLVRANLVLVPVDEERSLAQRELRVRGARLDVVHNVVRPAV